MRILTWNIQWGRGADGRVDLARTAAEAQRCDADVLCLQEVAVNHPALPGGAADDQVARLLQLLPGYSGFFGAGSDLPGPAGGRSLFGNLILSRLPALQAYRHMLPWPADPAVPSMARLAVEVVVAASWGPVRVISTHLEYYSALQRAAQVEGLRRLHAEACGHSPTLRPDRGVDAPFAAMPRPASAVFCGDFNFDPGSAEHRRMQEPIDGAPALIDAWSVAHPGEGHAASVGVNGAEWPDHSYCCDFLFVTEDLARRLRSVHVRAETAASDHQPVVAEFS